MSVTALLPSTTLSRVPYLSCIPRWAVKPAQRASIVAHAKIEEINTDDTIGVGSLLDRDFKIIELNENAFAEDADQPSTDASEEDEDTQPAASSASRAASSAAAGDGPKRSKEAINAGLDLFSKGNYPEAIAMFQLALELPGSGFMRMAGSPKEYACASEGEEQAALYNMACAYCRLGQSSAALTCLQGLIEESGFDDFSAIRNDPDLAPVRGPELDKLLSKYDGPLAKLFGGNKKKENTGEKPWIQW